MFSNLTIVGSICSDRKAAKGPISLRVKQPSSNHYQKSLLQTDSSKTTDQGVFFNINNQQGL